MPTKICTSCNVEKEESSFHLRKKNSLSRHAKCKLCTSKYQKDKIASLNGEELVAYRAKDRAKQQSRRANRATAILVDSKSSDRKRGFSFDLTRPFVEQMISCPCSYCGADDIEMTLDRIDNSKGHLMDNVVSSCVRCNMVRRDMPHRAWLTVAKGMREAREANLFGEWTGSIHKKLASRKGIEPL